MQKVKQIPIGTTAKVGNLHGVHQNVIGIELEQWIAVEHQRRNAGDNNGVEAHGPNGAGLPPSYSLFGKVVSGLDVVAAMQSVPTGAGDRPVDDVVINSVRITEAD